MTRKSDALAVRSRFFAVLSTSLEEFKRNELRYHTYYFTVNAVIGVLALCVAITSFIGLLGDVEFKRQLLLGIKSILPILRGHSDESFDVFRKVGVTAGIISMLFLVWAATRIFNALGHGFGIIWGTPQRRYSHMVLVGLLMIFIMGTLFLLSSAVQFSFFKLWGYAVDEGTAGYYAGLSLLRPLTGFLMDFLLFFFIYRIVTRAKPSLRNCAKGAALIAVLFLGSQYVLNLYFDYVYKVPLIYGSLASAIILILWMQLTGILTFYGAEVVHSLENEDLIREHVAQRKSEALA
ncbi:MAG: YihY/virulence factor BrkB family protein [Candidatus Geothermincolia bacterium]